MSHVDRIEIVLLVAVFVDLLGVALVVPNILFLFKDVLGDKFSPGLYGAISSVYSASQIVGGLIIGYLSDKSLGRKRTLMLSFFGAGLSYLVVGFAESIELLIVSRIIVGLVKQTMTCSTALMTEITNNAGRAAALGRLSSASTLAFLIGQPAGGLLATHMGRRAPCYLAAALFVADLVLVQLCLPNVSPGSRLTKDGPEPMARGAKDGAPASSSSQASQNPQGLWQRLDGVLSSFKSAFSGSGARVLVLWLVYGFLMRATYSLHSMYEQERWDLSPKTIGYLSFYKQV